MSKQAYLNWAEAFFFMNEETKNVHPELVAEGTYERRMWLNLFYWAGYKEVGNDQG